MHACTHTPTHMSTHPYDNLPVRPPARTEARTHPRTHTHTHTHTHIHTPPPPPHTRKLTLQHIPRTFSDIHQHTQHSICDTMDVIFRQVKFSLTVTSYSSLSSCSNFHRCSADCWTRRWFRCICRHCCCCRGLCRCRRRPIIHWQRRDMRKKENGLVKGGAEVVAHTQYSYW